MFDWAHIRVPSPQSSPKTSPRTLTPEINILKLSQTLKTLHLTFTNKPALEEEILLKISNVIHSSTDGYCCYEEMYEWIIRNANISFELEEIQNLFLFVKIYSSVGTVSKQVDFERIKCLCSLRLAPSADVKEWSSRVKSVEKNYNKKVLDYYGKPPASPRSTFVRRHSSKITPQNKYCCSDTGEMY